MYQFLSESAEFCRRYDKNICLTFFLGHSVYTGMWTLGNLYLGAANIDLIIESLCVS